MNAFETFANRFGTKSFIFSSQSPFSNLFPSEIIIDNIHFYSVEHYYQWFKLNVINMNEIANQMIECKDPNEVREMSRMYNIVSLQMQSDTCPSYLNRSCLSDMLEKELESKFPLFVQRELIKRAVMIKFSSHPELKKELIQTGFSLLGQHPGWNPTVWTIWPTGSPGLLGEILMETRTELRNNDSLSLPLSLPLSFPNLIPQINPLPLHFDSTSPTIPRRSLRLQEKQK